MSEAGEGQGFALLRFHSGDAGRCAKIAAMTKPRCAFWLGLLALTAVSGLSGCKSSPADDPQHDRQTEAAREQDCANPDWKAANLGLWYNICSGQQR